MLLLSRRLTPWVRPTLARTLSGPKPGQLHDCDDPIEEMDEFDRELLTTPINPDDLVDNDLAVKPAETPSFEWLRETDAEIDNELLRMSAEREGVQPDSEGKFRIEKLLSLEELEDHEYQKIMQKHVDKLPNLLGGRRPPIPPIDFDQGGDVWASPDLDTHFWPGNDLDEPAEIHEDVYDEQRQQFRLFKLDEDDEDSQTDPSLCYAILSIDRRTKVTKSGRVMSISALVAAGNRNGLAGFAVGRGSTSEEAQRKAMRKASKRLVFVPRLYEESLYQDTVGTKGATKVLIQAVPPGRGLHCSKLIRCFMELLGIRDATCKVIGSSNPYNVCHALLNGLSKQQDHGLIRAVRGNQSLPLKIRLPPFTARLPAGFDPTKTPNQIKDILTSLNIS